MQDRYVGDTGDYAKYALLNALAASAPILRLGVLWYLYPDEGHNDDGRHIVYLNQPAMAERDAQVHKALGQLVGSGQRAVAAVEEASILPVGTLFHSPLVTVEGSPGDRMEHRSRWFAEGLARFADVDIVFFDPDNGIETASLRKSDRRAGKYAFWKEIEAAWQRGHSLVVYSHLNRSASADVQTDRLRAAFQDRLDDAAVIPLLFRRGSCRHLWVIAQPRHKAALVERIRAFLDRGWSHDTQDWLPQEGSRLSIS